MFLEIRQVLGGMNCQRGRMVFIHNVLLLWLEAGLELGGSLELGTTAFPRCFSQGVMVLCS